MTVIISDTTEWFISGLSTAEPSRRIFPAKICRPVGGNSRTIDGDFQATNPMDRFTKYSDERVHVWGKFFFLLFLVLGEVCRTISFSTDGVVVEPWIFNRQLLASFFKNEGGNWRMQTNLNSKLGIGLIENVSLLQIVVWFRCGEVSWGLR